MTKQSSDACLPVKCPISAKRGFAFYTQAGSYTEETAFLLASKTAIRWEGGGNGGDVGDCSESPVRRQFRAKVRDAHPNRPLRLASTQTKVATDGEIKEPVVLFQILVGSCRSRECERVVLIMPAPAKVEA